MDILSLHQIAQTELAKAIGSQSGRAASTIYGGHQHNLRQTIIALARGRELAEHANPGEATLLVLHGKLVLSTEETAWPLKEGDYLAIPPSVHAVEAVEDAAFLLTVSVQR